VSQGAREMRCPAGVISVVRIKVAVQYSRVSMMMHVSLKVARIYTNGYDTI
jgi:hypothetical protein